MFSRLCRCSKRLLLRTSRGRNETGKSNRTVLYELKNDLTTRAHSIPPAAGSGQRQHLFVPCLDPKFTPKFHYAKRRFPVTSKCRQMHGVLNIDKIIN
jgi:hypothetical protein